MPSWANNRKVVPRLFLSPVILFALVFFVLPVGFAAYVSLTTWDSLSPPRWVGAKNYQYIFASDPVFLKTVWQTLYFAVGTLVIGVPLALLVAFAFSRVRHQGAWRVAYTLPMVTNIVAVGFIFWFVFRQTDGILNRLLALLGLPGPGWLTDPRLAMLSAILVFVWMELGRNMLLFAAGLGSIDESYAEAARLDGASEGQVFRHVTLPLLRPTILFVVVQATIFSYQLFEIPFLLTNGGPSDATLFLSQYLYEVGFSQFDRGYAAAIGYSMALISIFLTITQLLLYRRFTR